jgi:hypothetical protein
MEPRHIGEPPFWDDNLERFLERWVEAISQPPPPLLYHYTDFSGLQGILETGKLRATYTKVLNDGSERRYGETVVLNVLRSLLTADDGCWRDAIATALNDASRRTFVTCFCEAWDLLSMWRAYAGHGGGYCLGFASSALDNLGNDIHLRRIIYGEALPNPISVWIKHLAMLLNENFDAASPLLDFIPMLADVIKHEAFSEEKEWRLIITNPGFERMMFRAGVVNIRPYVELSSSMDNEKLPLKEVIYGPILREEDQPTQIIDWMLQKNGYKDIHIKPCNIPYRL